MKQKIIIIIFLGEKIILEYVTKTQKVLAIFLANFFFVKYIFDHKNKFATKKEIKNFLPH